MVIQYTVGGQERSYTVPFNDVRRVERDLNDYCGIPAEPMPAVIAFASYIMGEAKPEAFVEDLIKQDMISIDELFEMEPIEWFNTVVAPCLDEELGQVEIFNVIFDDDMLESKFQQCSKKMKSLHEEDESGSAKVEFTKEELEVIGGRIYVENEWGKEGVYDSEYVSIFKSIMKKLDDAGISYK